MADFRVGYMYSLAPIHCGGEGDLGNILEIAREVHTNFPYIPGSSWRGSLRNEVTVENQTAADALFGKELNSDGQMGVHQVWFGDARLLWVPMRTMANNTRDVFTWISCHSLVRDHALMAGLPPINFPAHAVGNQPGTYIIADAQIQVQSFSNDQKNSLALGNNLPASFNSLKSTWENSRIVLPDADFQVLMEHSLWTQVRNKIQEGNNEATSEGSAEVFWTDVCIPRDTILYYSWGYNLLKANPITKVHHDLLMAVIEGLLQVGGQANVGRGWVQSWVQDNTAPKQLIPSA
ncbi:MAG TPA: type III-B CRISPR module RAMP protein Cmr4 [Halomicronema sp.]